MENPENRVLVDFSKIDYVGGVCKETNSVYVVHFTGGNELYLYDIMPVHEYQETWYYPRELFISTWNLVLDETK